MPYLSHCSCYGKRGIGVRAIFCQGGGAAVNICPKILASCPNFCEAVEKKRGSCDALT